MFLGEQLSEKNIKDILVSIKLYLYRNQEDNEILMSHYADSLT